MIYVYIKNKICDVYKICKISFSRFCSFIILCDTNEIAVSHLKF